jgi:branched-chain amino acid transport system substrate-binding protein
MMTPASVNSKLTDNAFAKGWPTIMRFYARDDNQGKMVGAWMAGRYREKKIAFVHDKSTYGKNLADQVKANLNAAGVQEVLYEGLNPGEKDYSAVVDKMKALGSKSSITAAIRPRGVSFCVRLPTKASNSKW